MTCAVIGATFLMIGICFQKFWLPCFGVAGLEAITMFWASRLTRSYVYDTFELQALTDRYRPVLASCGSIDDLRHFATQVREEMATVSVDPRGTETTVNEQRAAISDQPES